MSWVLVALWVVLLKQTVRVERRPELCPDTSLCNGRVSALHYNGAATAQLAKEVRDFWQHHWGLRVYLLLWALLLLPSPSCGPCGGLELFLKWYQGTWYHCARN